MTRPARLALAVLGIAAPLLVGRFLPAAEGPVLCGFRNLTGIDCPGCGLTRSIGALLHGDLFRSLSAHPLGAIVFLSGMVLWASALWSWVRHGRFVSPIGARTPTWAFVLFFGVYLGVYFLRLAGFLGGTVDPPGPGLLSLFW